MSTTPTPNQIRCPSCGKNFVFDQKSVSMPFCSEQCKWVDLGRWMNEEIGLPHEASGEDDDESAPEIIREYRFD